MVFDTTHPHTPLLSLFKRLFEKGITTLMLHDIFEEHVKAGEMYSIFSPLLWVDEDE